MQELNWENIRGVSAKLNYDPNSDSIFNTCCHKQFNWFVMHDDGSKKDVLRVKNQI